MSDWMHVRFGKACVPTSPGAQKKRPAILPRTVLIETSVLEQR
jgi:hypothetical protein